MNQRPQVNMALAVSRTDKYPIASLYFQENGISFNLEEPIDMAGESSITQDLIWGRGNVSEDI